jgi:hypothetical protein
LSVPDDAITSAAEDPSEATFWDPQWSKSGNHLLVIGHRIVGTATSRRYQDSLFLTETKAFNPTPIGMTGAAWNRYTRRGLAAWSPDGERIAYQSYPPNGGPGSMPGSWGELSVHDIPNEQSRQVTAKSNLPPLGDYPAVHWSPSGQSLYFLQSPERIEFSETEIRKMPLNVCSPDAHLEPWRLTLATGALEKLSAGYADKIIGVR